MEITRTSDHQLKLREELEVSRSDLMHPDVSEKRKRASLARSPEI
jgi:hypothetical protein